MNVTMNRNYKRAKRIGLLDSYCKKVISKGFMPLNIERIGKRTLSIVHYYEQSGDLMKDPEVVFTYDDEKQIVEALSYELSGLGVYQEVYELDDDGNRTGVRPRAYKELNQFLFTFLKNIEDQGFNIIEARELNNG